MKPNERKIIYAFIAVAAILSVAVPWVLWNADTLFTDTSPKARTVAVLEQGLDTSNSLFSSGENLAFEQEFALKAEELRERPAITSQEVLNLARVAKDVRDYETALALFTIVEELGSDDFLVEVDIGKIYLQTNQPEKAAEYFEKSRIEYTSLYESYLGLAEAYKRIPDTPQYVIDDVYRMAIEEIPGQYEVYEAYVDWLEETGREKETIPYYENMNIINPQPQLETRLNELSTKYPQ